MTDSFPFTLDVSTCLQGDMPEQSRKVGDSPVRVDTEVIGIAGGEEVVIDGIVANLGSGVMIDAAVTAKATGECVRCLAPLDPKLDFHIPAVLFNSEDFITGDDAEEEDIEDEVGQTVDNTVDITQAVIDRTGLNLLFSPTCLDLDSSCTEPDSEVPEPDGISGEGERIDPCWAGLAERFGSLGDDE